MVGISGQTTATDADAESFRKSLDPLTHMDRYEATVMLNSSEYSLGVTAYPEYPTAIYENETHWVYLEGRIYDDGGAERDHDGENEITREKGHDGADSGDKYGLLSLAETVFEHGDNERVEDWVTETDGEFLLVAYEKDSGRLALLNDALGRLPVYYAQDGETFVFSRELRYLVSEFGDSFDQMGIAQCLLLGHSLGERTLLEGVNRMRPASLLVFDPDHGLTTETTVQTFAFDENEHADRSAERNASELVSLFERACRQRSSSKGTDVISLSGGLDSRSVLAGYQIEEQSPVAATMESSEYVPQSDVEIARVIAAEFDVEWQTYQVSHPVGRDLETLIKTKNGQVGLLTSFILGFFRQIREEYGSSLSYITGDGGDMVLPDLTPARSLTMDELVDQVIQQYGIFPVEDVAEITGLSESAIRESIRSRFEEYPETDPNALYVHFRIYERAVNFLFEGEDRNRFFFWSTTPFYSLPFFTYAMHCPSEQKVQYNLYRTFLTDLSPEAARIRHPNYRAPVASSRHAMVAMIDDLLSRYPRVMESIKPVIKSVNDLDTEASLQPDTIECIRSQVNQCGAVSDVFSSEDVHQFLDSHADYGRVSIYRIFALTSFIDDISSNQPVLNTYRNNTFV
ncbi:asparagine synthase (glutamine-hydrolysing) [Natronorubrum daqingense]|uniref:Asparagine synthase (Glutamine-hydrolysing) n=2 Tax=Natronorubrum daqingense TaxID=588898 RepID=A0A1N7FLB7_9EURY|nr:asparagine synthase (glutamine-hydrolysing) [Natronorubrum daqingense]